MTFLISRHQFIINIERTHFSFLSLYNLTLKESNRFESFNFKMQFFFNPPKTHSIFKAKCNLTGKIVDYKIQDLPEGRYYEAVELFARDYLHCEPMCVSRKMYDNENTRNEFRKLWMNTMRQAVSIACFNSVGTMVGVNILMVTRKDEQKVSEVSF